MSLHNSVNGPTHGGHSRSPVPFNHTDSQSSASAKEHTPQDSSHAFRLWLERNVSVSGVGAFKRLEELICVGEQSPSSLFMNRTLSLATAYPVPVLAEIADSIPQIIVTGDQSAGKSTMLEALVGFRFNVVASTMATKRPLVIHMIPSSEHTTPLCTLTDCGTEVTVNVEHLAQKITSLQPTGISVSSNELLLTIRYSNFSYGQEIRIVDLPGLRATNAGSAVTDEQKVLAEDILSMTKGYLERRKDSIWLVMLGDGQINNLSSPSFLKDIVDAKSMRRKPIMLISKFQKRLDEFSKSGGGADMKTTFENESEGLGTICGLWDVCYLLEFSPHKFIYGETYNPSHEMPAAGLASDTFETKSKAWREHCQLANQAMLEQATLKGAKDYLPKLDKFIFDSMKKDMTTILNAEYAQRAQVVSYKLLHAISDCQRVFRMIDDEKSSLESLDANHCINLQKIKLFTHIRDQWTNAGSGYSIPDKDHLEKHYFTAAQEKMQEGCDWKSSFQHEQNMSIYGKPWIKAAAVDSVFISTNINDLDTPLIGAAAFLRLRREFKLVLMNANMEDAGEMEIGNPLGSGFSGAIRNAADPATGPTQVALNRARKLRLILKPYINRLGNIFRTFVTHCCQPKLFPITSELKCWTDVTEEVRCKFLDVILGVVEEQVGLLETQLEDFFFTNTLSLDDSLVFGAPGCEKVKVEDVPMFLSERLQESVKQLSHRPADWEPAMADNAKRSKHVNHIARQYFFGLRHFLGMSINAFHLRFIDDFMMGNVQEGAPSTFHRFADKFERHFNPHLVDLRASISLKTKPRIDQLQSQNEFLQNIIGEAIKLKNFYNEKVQSVASTGHQ